MNRLGLPQRVVPKICRSSVCVRTRYLRARVIATYARRRSSSISSCPPGSMPLYGNISSSIPVSTTSSNSSPFAPCTVISVARGALAGVLLLERRAIPGSIEHGLEDGVRRRGRGLLAELREELVDALEAL